MFSKGKSSDQRDIKKHASKVFVKTSIRSDRPFYRSNEYKKPTL